MEAAVDVIFHHIQATLFPAFTGHAENWWLTC